MSNAVMSYADCRRAARRVRATTEGRRAVRAARSRFVSGLTRNRAPLGLMLYRAALDDRLVYLDDETFAIVEPPVTPPVRVRRRGVRRRVLRFVDGGWPWLISYGPAVLVFLAALGDVLFFPRSAVQVQVLLVVLLVLVSYATLVTLVGSVVVGAAGLYRLGVTLNEGERNRLVLDRLRDRHWSVRLYHARDAESAGALCRQVMRFVDDRRVEAPGPEPVLCRAALVTTEEARAALHAVDAARPLFGGDLETFVLARGRVPLLRDPFGRRARPGVQVSVFVGSIAVFSVVMAQAVAETEGGACRGAAACSDRPADFLSALYWVLSYVFNADSSGISAHTWAARFMGLLTSVVGIVVITWIIAFFFQDAATRTRKYAVGAVERFNAAVRAGEPETPPARQASPPRLTTAVGAGLLGMAIGLVIRHRRRR